MGRPRTVGAEHLYGLHSPRGRMLLALRAQHMGSDQLAERCGGGYFAVLQTLMKAGFARERQDGRFELTPAGVARCPSRRSVLAARDAVAHSARFAPESDAEPISSQGLA